VTVGTGGASSPENGAGPAQVFSGVAEFGENLMTLAELQARLAAMEMRQNVEAVKVTGLVVMGGALLAMASLPVILIGLAELLASGLGMGRGPALLGVSIVALLIGGACAAIAGIRLRHSTAGFPVSREELARNLNWVRTVMLHSGRPARQ
jgi:hypothetical protein